MVSFGSYRGCFLATTAVVSPGSFSPVVFVSGLVILVVVVVVAAVVSSLVFCVVSSLGFSVVVVVVVVVVVAGLFLYTPNLHLSQ